MRRVSGATLLCLAAVCCSAGLPAAALELPESAVAGLTMAAEAEAASTFTKPTPLVAAEAVALEQGSASSYARHFQGRRTANGERYDQNELTAAHKTLPFGTMVRVRSKITGQEIDVRINDRGPFVTGRIIDLSHAAARALGMLQMGVKKVTLLLPPGLRPKLGVGKDTRPTGARNAQ